MLKQPLFLLSAILITGLTMHSPKILAISKCTGADGSISYVQGNCPGIKNERESVRVWDSDKKSYRPDTTVPQSIDSGHQKNPTPQNTSSRRGPRHPCNASTSSTIQMRIENRACKVLSAAHDPNNKSCRELASGNWQFRSADILELRAMIAQCEATGGNSVRSDNEESPQKPLCQRMSPVERLEKSSKGIVLPGMTSIDVNRAWGRSVTPDIKLPEKTVHRTYRYEGDLKFVVFQNECVKSVSP
jgi:hypothetical protein